MMDDRIRVSDADRERVTARLREHFAEGRLSSEELDERISAALAAKTLGELRRTTADLPEPAPGPGPGQGWQDWQAPPRLGRTAGFGRRPRLLPLALLALIAVLLIPGGGWVFAAFFQLVLAVWLVACLAGAVAMMRFRRHVRGHWNSGDGSHWDQYQ
jgi:hypothetical protein